MILHNGRLLNVPDGQYLMYNNSLNKSMYIFDVTDDMFTIIYSLHSNTNGKNIEIDEAARTSSIPRHQLSMSFDNDLFKLREEEYLLEMAGMI